MRSVFLIITFVGCFIWFLNVGWLLIEVGINVLRLEFAKVWAWIIFS